MLQPMSGEKLFDLRTASLAGFSGLEGQAFRVLLGPETVLEARLHTATRLGAGDGSRWKELAKREPFSLMFHFPANSGLPQGSYALEHPDLGRMELFLVPVGIDSQGVRMQAVFN